jgi:hypothetical protein
VPEGFTFARNAIDTGQKAVELTANTPVFCPQLTAGVRRHPNLVARHPNGR